MSVEKIKEIPKKTMNIVFEINRSLRGLLKNTEIVNQEMARFRMIEERIEESVIGFGIEPVGISPVEAVNKFTPLADYLTKKMGKKVELRAVSDYEGAIRDIGKGITQVSFMTPTTYLEAHKKYGVEVLVKALTAGKSANRSVIIAKSDSDISSVEDIRGRTFAFGDPHSLSSYIAPRVLLFDMGIDLKDLLYYDYLGPHEQVLNAVLQGKFDSGGVSETIATKFKDKGIKFIKFSDELPGFCICVSKGIAEKDKSVLITALTALTDATSEGTAILNSIYKRYTSFKETSDAEYDMVRIMMSKLGLI
jgi:phosphonate transport system substrate-binding protein